VSWSPDQESSPGQRPALIISALSTGERRISDDLVVLMTQRYPGLPLLMLCTDELVRPTVSLQDGRVTLLGPQLTVERIAARVRILVADQRADSTQGGGTLNYGEAADPHFVSHEHTNRHAYFAFAASSGAQGRAEEFVPVVQAADGQGITALLNVAQPLPAAALARATEALEGDEEDDDKERLLVESLGSTAALVALGRNGEWQFHWPAAPSTLLLASPLRLPRVWNYSNSLGRTESTFLRAPSAAGDVLFALWGMGWPTESATAQEDEARLMEAALAGGPKVLDLLAERLKRSDRPGVGFVMEVR
jgi:hypothetical protein